MTEQSNPLVSLIQNLVNIRDILEINNSIVKGNKIEDYSNFFIPVWGKDNSYIGNVTVKNSKVIAWKPLSTRIQFDLDSKTFTDITVNNFNLNTDIEEVIKNFEFSRRHDGCVHLTAWYDVEFDRWCCSTTNIQDIFTNPEKSYWKDRDNDFIDLLEKCIKIKTKLSLDKFLNHLEKDYVYGLVLVSPFESNIECYKDKNNKSRFHLFHVFTIHTPTQTCSYKHDIGLPKQKLFTFSSVDDFFKYMENDSNMGLIGYSKFMENMRIVIYQKEQVKQQNVLGRNPFYSLADLDEDSIKFISNKLPKIADIITIQSGLKNKNLEDRFKNQFSILVNFFSWLYKMRHIKQKSIIVEKQFNIVDKWIHNMYREAKKTENPVKVNNELISNILFEHPEYTSEQIYWMMERKCNSFSNLRKRVVTSTETDEMET